NLFLPLGMNSTFFYYSSFSPLSKRIPPGNGGTLPDFLSFADLNWARPTGQAYSTVNDLSQIVKMFLRTENSKRPYIPNQVGLYGSTLQEMLAPVYVNSDQVSAYGFPFEIYFSSI